jgi:tryptophan halogenase
MDYPLKDNPINPYHLTQRTDSDFWNDMRTMKIPNRLANKLTTFADTAAIFNDNNDIFRDASWLQVMLGQGVFPTDYHPAAKVPSNEELIRTF